MSNEIIFYGIIGSCVWLTVVWVLGIIHLKKSYKRQWTLKPEELRFITKRERQVPINRNPPPPPPDRRVQSGFTPNKPPPNIDTVSPTY